MNLTSLVGALKVEVLSASDLLSIGSAQENVPLKTHCSSHPSLFASEINLPAKPFGTIPQML